MSDLIELPIYESGPRVNELISKSNILRVKPDKNWTRIERKQGDDLLIMMEYEDVKKAILLETLF